MKLRLFLAMFLGALAVTPLTFATHVVNTGTTTCNGNNVVLNYVSGFDTSGNSGSPIHFSIDASIAGATPTCDGGYAFYTLSGPFTVTFSAPIIGSDSTAYENIFSNGPFPYNSFNYYFGEFAFDDTTSGVDFPSNIFAVATNGSDENGTFTLSGNQITFDPVTSTTVVIYGNGAPPVFPTPEPETLALVASALGSVGLIRRKFLA